MAGNGVLTGGRRTGVMVIFALAVVIVVVAALSELWLVAIASMTTVTLMSLALRRDRADRMP